MEKNSITIEIYGGVVVKTTINPSNINVKVHYYLPVDFDITEYEIKKNKKGDEYVEDDWGNYTKSPMSNTIKLQEN